MILGQETPQECQNDSLKSYHHARKSCTSHEMKRYDRGVSPQGNGNCEAGSETGMSYEFMHRAHRASTEGRKMGGSVGVWGTPCSIQRGLTRRLCILLVCTDPLSALAPKLQEVYGPLRFGPRLGGGGHSAWCTRLAKELDRPPHHACEFSARLMGGRMLEIQCFSLTRQNYFDVRSLF
jgi:hypothetical protein